MKRFILFALLLLLATPLKAAAEEIIRKDELVKDRPLAAEVIKTIPALDED